MTTELLYQIALFRLYPWSNRKQHQLLDRYGSASEVWHHTDVPGMDEAMQEAEQELAFIDKHQLSTYFYRDDNYPYRLKQCPDAPVLLYGKGNLRPNEGKMVSIVGTRMATDRGKELTRRLVLDLKEWVPDITVISGLAYGIDVAAHRAALEAGLPTIIVPAHGLDRIYPNLHRSVAIEALANGGILTEYTSGTEPEKQNFVARNRIVAGLADAVVVVESKSKGGSLITARMANDYNREVFTFPGRATDEYSQGCNALIAHQQATLIQGAEDLVQHMQWATERNLPTQTELVELTADITDTRRQLLDKLHEEEDGLHVNMLVMETQRSYSDVIADLMMMTLSGIVKELPGGIYKALK